MASFWFGLVCFVFLTFCHAVALSVCPLSCLCFLVSNLLVNRSKGKQLMASYLLRVPKKLSQAGDHCCWYHPWGTPVMPMCFSAAHHPQEPRTCLSTWCPMHTPQTTVTSNWFGNQWCCPRRSIAAEGGGPGLVGKTGAGGDRWAPLGMGTGGACRAGCAQ